MTIRVDYQPVQYTFEGDWFCDHLGEPVIHEAHRDSLNFAGEHYTYVEDLEACGECGELL